MSTPVVETKYIIIGIDPTSGSYVYEQKTQNEAAVTNDDVTSNPYDLLKVQNPANKKFVKIKVQQSSIEPIGSNEQRPSFKLNEKWYTLVLDEKVDHADIDPVASFVTSEWFYETSGSEDPFDAFRYFYNHDLVVKNVKYLFRLPDSASNFNTVFADFKNAIVRGSPLNDIRKELAKPYFAVKTILDMNTSIIRKIDTGESMVNNYFINLPPQRYGYPNIKGDKSNIITGLHMLYDIQGYLTYNASIIDANLIYIQTIHKHIKDRTYFLNKKSYLEDGINNFESDVGKMTLPDLVVAGSPYAFLQHVCNLEKIEFLDLRAAAAAAAAPAAPAAAPTFIKEIVIVYGKSSTPDNYELVSQIFKLDKIGQYVFYDLNNKTMYNDIEIRDDSEINTIMSYYIESDETISLYRRIDPGTYRDLFLQKFFMDSGTINTLLTTNPSFTYIDQYISIDGDNAFHKNTRINNFVKAYLACKSKIDLDKIITEKFKATNSRFGICNFNGELSHFTAAMQLIYDCCPMRTGLLQSMINGAANLNGQTDIQSLFIFMLLNLEYCVSRICSNIEVILPTGKMGNNPLSMMMLAPGGKQVNVFSNYKNCVEFIENIVRAFRYIGGDKDLMFKGKELMFKGKDGIQAKSICENFIDKIDNNYYFREYNKNVFTYFKEKIDELIKAQAGKSAQTEQDKFRNEVESQWIINDILFGADLLADLYGNDAQSRREEIINKKIEAATKKQLPEATKKILTEFENKRGREPHIIKNKCVETIHKLFGILSAGNNVFIDFMDDERELTERQKHFTTKPTFVILVGKLPRKTLLISDATYVTVTIAAAPERNGVYERIVENRYDHTEQNGWRLVHDGAKWQSVYIDENGIAKDAIDFGTDTAAELLLTEFTKTLGKNVIVEPGTPVITQNENDILSMPPAVTTPGLPDTYTFGDKEYKKIGTIYKSIYHDHYYKYCTHGELNEVFFDCSKENVPGIDARMTRENMFAFIRLYESPDLDYKKYFVNEHPFLYPDILKFVGNSQVNTTFNITSPYVDSSKK